MISAFLLCFIYLALFWLIFFKLKWLRFTFAWGAFSVIFLAHVLFIFMIGLRFVTPYSSNAKIIQHTIQITPRLSEPTLVTAVLVQPDEPVKKGQPLFQFDRRIYEYKVQELKAQLQAALQNVKVLKANIDINKYKLDKEKTELAYTKYQQSLTADLAANGAGPQEDAQRGAAQFITKEAAVKETAAELERARIEYQSNVNGINTGVAAIEAQLAQALFYLNNTTIYAPEDGRIVNMQVRPGMVAGDVRFGAIASFICDSGRYFLVNFFQENIKYVKVGQPVEVALDLYPGQIFPAKVEAIWKASGVGQLLPSGKLPDFEATPPEKPQAQFAVKVVLDGADQSLYPIGTQGAAAIYTSGMKGSWAALRRIGIRTYSWMNWLYPIPF